MFVWRCLWRGGQQGYVFVWRCVCGGGWAGEGGGLLGRRTSSGGRRGGGATSGCMCVYGPSTLFSPQRLLILGPPSPASLPHPHRPPMLPPSSPHPHRPPMLPPSSPHPHRPPMLPPSSQSVVASNTDLAPPPPPRVPWPLTPPWPSCWIATTWPPTSRHPSHPTGWATKWCWPPTTTGGCWPTLCERGGGASGGLVHEWGAGWPSAT